MVFSYIESTVFSLLFFDHKSKAPMLDTCKSTSEARRPLLIINFIRPKNLQIRNTKRANWDNNRIPNKGLGAASKKDSTDYTHGAEVTFIG